MRGWILVRDPHTSVADQQRHVRPRRDLRMPRRVRFVHFHVRRPDGQRPAVRHGIHGVHRQVHQHLVQLPRIGHDGPLRGIGLDDQLDIFPDQALQHGLVLGHQAAQIHRSGLDDLFAAESQQLAGEIGGALSRLANLLDPLPQWIAGLVLAEQQIAVAVDYRQQVIEVMGDAAGQAPDALQLLRLPELLFQLDLFRFGALLFRDVPGYGQQ